MAGSHTPIQSREGYICAEEGRSTRTTGFDVWQLCETIDNYGSVAKVVADFPLVSELHCRLARSYREAYPEEIEGAIASNNRSRAELQALYPFIEWVSYEELTAE